MTAITRDLDIHDDITPVPPVMGRRLSAVQIGVLWFDLGVGLLVLAAGGILVGIFGLSLPMALVATAIGSVIGSAILGAVSRVSSDTGVPTMVALRPALGIRGSALGSLLNVLQLVGWAGLEFIIMAQAARAISDEFFGFEGYYLWLTFAAVVATVFAFGGPIVVVHAFLQRFGFWIVVAATLWLFYRLFVTYDIHESFDDWHGSRRNFWLGVDLAVALPASWLPLVGDYSRYARNSTAAAISTFASYAIANFTFFALGIGYAIVLAMDAGPSGEPIYDAFDPNSLIAALVDSMLGLTLGWLFLLVILTDEADNAFANVYSTAVSIQNVVRVSQRMLALLVGVAAFVLAVSVDLLGYETFLLLIGGVFVSLFGVMIADYFIVHGRRYDTGDLFRDGGRYWFFGGVNAAGLLAWAAGFSTFMVCGRPQWALDNIDGFERLPMDLNEFGGTIPSLLVSVVLYVLLQRVQASLLASGRDTATANARP